MHIKDVLRLVDDPDAVIDASVVRPLPRVPADMPLPDALSRLRRSNSHLALVTAPDGSVVAMVALEDLVEDLVGTVRDGTHACLSASWPRTTGWRRGRPGAHARGSRRFIDAAPSARPGR